MNSTLKTSALLLIGFVGFIFSIGLLEIGGYPDRIGWKQMMIYASTTNLILLIFALKLKDYFFITMQLILMLFLAEGYFNNTVPHGIILIAAMILILASIVSIHQSGEFKKEGR